MVRVKDGRSLLGGLSLIVAGIVLSAMSYLYFEQAYTGSGILRARWLWEIILNLQIFCLATMWFCYLERINGPDPIVAVQMRMRLALSLFAVLVPTWIALLSAYLGWFYVLPGKNTIDALLGTMVVFWTFASLMPRLWKRRRGADDKRVRLILRRKFHIAWSLPLIGAGAVIIIDLIRRENTSYLWLPFLLYTQAAVPYIRSGLVTVSAEEEYSTEND